MASQPVTLTDLFGEDITLDQIVEEPNRCDDFHVLIGHIDRATAQQRIDGQGWDPAMLVTDLEHGYVVFDRHDTYCDHRGAIALDERCPSLLCSPEPWVRYHWRQADKHDSCAYPASFVLIDEVAIDSPETVVAFQPAA